MEEVKLDVQIRNAFGSGQAKKMRREEIIPAVVYGGDKETTSIQVNRRVYEGIMRHHRGENVVFHLNVLEGEKKLRDYSVIVKEEQLHPVDDDILHIDFYRISLTEKIEVSVTITVKGEAIGVKKGGGTLDHHLWEIDVICLPTNIPTHIDVDVSSLEIGQSIHVKDLNLPEGVETEHDPEDVVVAVAEQQEMEIPEESEEAATEPEVIKEKAKADDKEGGKEDGKEEKAEACGEKGK